MPLDNTPGENPPPNKSKIGESCLRYSLTANYVRAKVLKQALLLFSAWNQVRNKFALIVSENKKNVHEHLLQRKKKCSLMKIALT